MMFGFRDLGSQLVHIVIDAFASGDKTASAVTAETQSSTARVRTGLHDPRSIVHRPWASLAALEGSARYRCAHPSVAACPAPLAAQVRQRPGLHRSRCAGAWECRAAAGTPTAEAGLRWARQTTARSLATDRPP